MNLLHHDSGEMKIGMREREISKGLEGLKRTQR